VVISVGDYGRMGTGKSRLEAKFLLWKTVCLINKMGVHEEGLDYKCFLSWQYVGSIRFTIVEI
jgi:hypothetical protein